MLELLLASDGYICAKGQTARLVRHFCWSSEQPLGLDAGLLCDLLHSHWGWMLVRTPWQNVYCNQSVVFLNSLLSSWPLETECCQI